MTIILSIPYVVTLVSDNKLLAKNRVIAAKTNDGTSPTNLRTDILV